LYLDFHGSIFIGNQTTGLHTSLFLIPPPDASAAGNSIERIMEAPFGGEPAVALPKFSPVIFTSAVGSGPDNAVGNPQNGDTVNIETKPVNGQVLTSVTVGNETVTINFIG
jgi:hypothetical protein